MSRVCQFLSKQSGLREADVRAIILRAPRSYKFFKIPKRTGGQREIAQPAREVKALQRMFVRGLSRLPIHDCATAYRQGLSIKDNAERHASNSGAIMKFDFRAFFPSIKSYDWIQYCENNGIFQSEEDIYLSTNLLFHRPYKSSERLILAMGAPSSPWLSNVLMYDFDRALCGRLASENVTYSRYADDLTFSAPRTGFLTRVPKALSDTIREVKSPSLKLNDSKTVLATAKYKRVVTGLVLTNAGTVSVGRERKRKIRAMLHYAATGKLDGYDLLELRGLLSFAMDIEPAYFKSAISKYHGKLPLELQSLFKIKGDYL